MKPPGGAEGNRTPDLLNAIQALSQLSYGPTGFAAAQTRASCVNSARDCTRGFHLLARTVEDSEDLHPAIRGLKTVCRCENIKYKTIERAIREGAWTLSQVASRTGATLGQCGGTCTPDVQAMITEHAPKHSAPDQQETPAQTLDKWWVKKK